MYAVYIVVNKSPHKHWLYTENIASSSVQYEGNGRNANILDALDIFLDIVAHRLYDE